MLNFFLKTLSVATLNIATSPFAAIFLCFVIFFFRKSKILRLLAFSTACYGGYVFLPTLMGRKELATAEISPSSPFSTQENEEASSLSLDSVPTAEETDEEASLSLDSAAITEESEEINEAEAESELAEKTPNKKGFFGALLGVLPFLKSSNEAEEEIENPGLQIPLEKKLEADTNQAIEGANGKKKQGWLKKMQKKILESVLPKEEEKAIGHPLVESGEENKEKLPQMLAEEKSFLKKVRERALDAMLPEKEDQAEKKRQEAQLQHSFSRYKKMLVEKTQLEKEIAPAKKLLSRLRENKKWWHFRTQRKIYALKQYIKKKSEEVEALSKKLSSQNALKKEKDPSGVEKLARHHTSPFLPGGGSHLLNEVEHKNFLLSCLVLPAKIFKKNKAIYSPNALKKSKAIQSRTRIEKRKTTAYKQEKQKTEEQKIKKKIKVDGGQKEEKSPKKRLPKSPKVNFSKDGGYRPPIEPPLKTSNRKGKFWKIVKYGVIVGGIYFVYCYFFVAKLAFDRMRGHGSNEGIEKGEDPNLEIDASYFGEESGGRAQGQQTGAHNNMQNPLGVQIARRLSEWGIPRMDWVKKAPQKITPYDHLEMLARLRGLGEAELARFCVYTQRLEWGVQKNHISVEFLNAFLDADGRLLLPWDRNEAGIYARVLGAGASPQTLSSKVKQMEMKKRYQRRRNTQERERAQRQPNQESEEAARALRELQEAQLRATDAQRRQDIRQNAREMRHALEQARERGRDAQAQRHAQIEQRQTVRARTENYENFLAGLENTQNARERARLEARRQRLEANARAAEEAAASENQNEAAAEDEEAIRRDIREALRNLAAGYSELVRARASEQLDAHAECHAQIVREERERGEADQEREEVERAQRQQQEAQLRADEAQRRQNIQQNARARRDALEQARERGRDAQAQRHTQIEEMGRARGSRHFPCWGGTTEENSDDDSSSEEEIELFPNENRLRPIPMGRSIRLSPRRQNARLQPDANGRYRMPGGRPRRGAGSGGTSRGGNATDPRLRRGVEGMDYRTINDFDYSKLSGVGSGLARKGARELIVKKVSQEAIEELAKRNTEWIAKRAVEEPFVGMHSWFGEVTNPTAAQKEKSLKWLTRKTWGAAVEEATEELAEKALKEAALESGFKAGFKAAGQQALSGVAIGAGADYLLSGAGTAYRCFNGKNSRFKAAKGFEKSFEVFFEEIWEDAPPIKDVAKKSAGSTAGAMLLGTLGSVVPVVGTTVGAFLGGAIGGWLAS